MKHEIKITMTFEDNEPINNSNIIFHLDDAPIGCIQGLKLSASVQENFPSLEITFPDLINLPIDPNYRDADVFAKQIEYQAKQLGVAPNIFIKMKSIDGDYDNISLDEIGTDGHIDNYPLNREK